MSSRSGVLQAQPEWRFTSAIQVEATFQSPDSKQAAGRQPTPVMVLSKRHFGVRRHATKEKRASDFPPELSTRAFFRTSFALPGSIDFPPDFRSKHCGLALFEAGVRQRTERLLNDQRMPENQDFGSNLGSRNRPCGPKIGHNRDGVAFYKRHGSGGDFPVAR